MRPFLQILATTFFCIAGTSSFAQVIVDARGPAAHESPKMHGIKNLSDNGLIRVELDVSAWPGDTFWKMGRFPTVKNYDGIAIWDYGIGKDSQSVLRIFFEPALRRGEEIRFQAYVENYVTPDCSGGDFASGKAAARFYYETTSTSSKTRAPSFPYQFQSDSLSIATDGGNISCLSADSPQATSDVSSCILELTASQPLLITGLYLNVNGGSPVEFQVDLYVYRGRNSHDPCSMDPDGWTLIGTGQGLSDSMGCPTNVVLTPYTGSLLSGTNHLRIDFTTLGGENRFMQASPGANVVTSNEDLSFKTVSGIKVNPIEGQSCYTNRSLDVSFCYLNDPDFSVFIVDDVDGPKNIRIEAAAPHTPVTLIYGTRGGRTETILNGQSVIFSMLDPHVYRTKTTDHLGNAGFRLEVNRDLEGQSFLIQAVQHTLPELSNLLLVKF